MLLTGLLAFQFAVAQTPVRCYTMQTDSMMRAANPNLGTLQDFENWMQQQLTQQALVGSQNRTNSVRVIPTVVHVIYSNTQENISDAQVISQIDILNEDFRRLNADTVNTPIGFRPAAADCQIEFCLAQIDPNGNPTNGIHRVSMAGSPFSQSTVNNTIKPATSWDPNNYFNIWVCNLSGGLLGWAQFPNSSGLSGMNANNGNANTDGVVLLHASVGRPPYNPFPGPYNLGRTATHEVGHWLGLRHIWGDGNCTVDDFCNDTPTSDAANYGCPTTHVSCSTVDMVQNYMDYTDDGCMNIFTADQKARMDVVLGVSPRRASLLLSTVCNPTGVSANFSGNILQGCAPLTVQFTDQSLGNITSWNWNFGGQGTSTQQNPSFTFNNPGLYTITLTISDGTNSDSEIKTDYIVVIGAGSGQTLPFSETFESGTFPPTGWTLNNPDNSTTWVRATVGGITPGTNAAKMDYFNYNAVGQRDGLISPTLDLSGYSSATMDFDHAYRRYNNSATDSLIIYVSTQCGGNWQRVVGWGENGSGTQFRTSSNTTTNWTPSTASHWCFSGTVGTACKVVDLSPYCGNSFVQVKFEGYNGYSNNLYLDNININGVLAPLAPVAQFSTSSTTVCAGTTVTFTDQSTNTPTGWTWNFGDGGNSSAQNPTHTYTTAGTYTVTLTATNGNGTDSEVKSNHITVNPRPAPSLNPTATTCGLTNGSVSTTVSGGSGFTYLWSNGATTQNLTNVASGSYTVTVTNSAGCTQTATVTVGSSTGINATASSTSTSCGQANGTVSASATGGSGYTYLWSNGATTATVNNLASGSYTVTVTASNGCTRTATATVGNSTAVSASASSVSTSCGLNNGTASASATGGSGYSYLWSNGATTANLSNLASGSYTVTVTASNGCTSTATTTVGNSSAISASASGAATTCGLNNGTASASATGGSGYTYLWSNGATTATLSNLASGSYTVTVTASNGCTSTATTTVGSSTGINATASSVATSCGQNNGSVSASATGGSGYTYLWSNGATTASVNNLPSGSYTVTVTASNGCTRTATATVGNSTAVSASATSITTSCGLNNGTASATATGGSGYTYLWSNGATTANLSNLASSTYTVTVTASNGCTSTATTTVGSSNGITASASGVSTTCGLNDGSASATATGGSGYTYLWSNGANTASLNNLASGTYTVTVTASNGCTSTATTTVGSSNGISSTASAVGTSCGQNDGTATVTPSGGSGYTYIWNTGSTTASISNLAAGNYSVTVTSSNGCTTTSSTTVSGSTAAAVSATAISTSCGLANGSATATGSGTAPFTFLWSNGANTATVGNLSPGTYTVTMTDANGCSDQTTATVQASTALQVSASGTSVTCNGLGDGTATATAPAGLPPFTYAWSNGSTAASLAGLAPGTYAVTVTDASGCSGIASVTVSEPTVLSGSVTGTDETAPGANDGTATATPAGGTAPYTYAWSNGGSTATISNLAGGTYSVTITDANGCITEQSIVLNTLTSLSQTVDAGWIKVYPNPSNGQFWVEYQFHSLDERLLTVWNPLGQSVWEGAIPGTTGKLQVILPQVAAGSYQVVIHGPSTRFTKVIVVQ